MKETILVTGATDGIGKETAIQLAAKGYPVVVHGRSEESCRQAVDEINQEVPEAALSIIAADFSDLEQVEQMAEEVRERFPDLKVLVNNAGIYTENRQLSEQGFELTFAVNYLALYSLTMNLLPLLKKNAPARIINVSSTTHHRSQIDFDRLPYRENYDGHAAYAESKLAIILFSYTLADVVKEDGITVNALHPGTIATKLLHSGFSSAGAPVSAGAETPVYLAVSAEVEGVTGKYFEKKTAVPSSKSSYDQDDQERLWVLSKKWADVNSAD